MSEHERQMTSPGKLLHAAREALGMTPSQVAEKLHLSVQVIKDIEKDDYSHFHALIYLRGYLRTYAKVVGIPVENVMAALDQMDNLPVRDAEHTINSNGLIFTRVPSSRRHWWRWISVSIILFLFILVALWWRGQESHIHSNVNSFSQIQSGITSATVDANDNAPTGITDATNTTQQTIVSPIVSNQKTESVSQAQTVAAPAVKHVEKRIKRIKHKHNVMNFRPNKKMKTTYTISPNK